MSVRRQPWLGLLATTVVIAVSLAFVSLLDGGFQAHAPTLAPKVSDQVAAAVRVLPGTGSTVSV